MCISLKLPFLFVCNIYIIKTQLNPSQSPTCPHKQYKLIGRATRASQLALRPTAIACIQTLNYMLINSPHFLVHLLQIPLIPRKIFLRHYFHGIKIFVLRSKFEIYIPDYPIAVFLKLGLAEQFLGSRK